MTEPEIQNHIATLQRWLAGAWRRLGDPTLTLFDKRELRNQMKQCSNDLRAHLQRLAEQRAQPVPPPATIVGKPDLRILSC